MEGEGLESKDIFTRHLEGRCTDEERESLAIAADTLLKALQAGQGLDVAGVMITGDLMLDRLPAEPVNVQAIQSPRIRDILKKEGLQEVRMIKGPFSIRHSLVRGSLATNLRQGYLLVDGPVVMTGTTFQRSVDFSRMMFVEPVDFSEVVILHEGFFIKAVFDRGGRFEKTAFGTHSRFHKAIFGGATTFLRAGFSGLAEFLEVGFEKEASFSRTYFKMGTGFSGSRFGGPLDFSESLFEKEVYFRFTVFEDDVYFRRTTFRSTADFTNAKFGAVRDFTKVLFEVQPTFAGTKLQNLNQSLKGLQDPRIQYGIFVALLIFTLVFIFILKKRA